jgi:hypothetical protein
MTIKTKLKLKSITGSLANLVPSRLEKGQSEAYVVHNDLSDILRYYSQALSNIHGTVEFGSSRIAEFKGGDGNVISYGHSNQLNEPVLYITASSLGVDIALNPSHLDADFCIVDTNSSRNVIFSVIGSSSSVRIQGERKIELGGQTNTIGASGSSISLQAGGNDLFMSASESIKLIASESLVFKSDKFSAKLDSNFSYDPSGLMLFATGGEISTFHERFDNVTTLLGSIIKTKQHLDFAQKSSQKTIFTFLSTGNITSGTSVSLARYSGERRTFDNLFSPNEAFVYLNGALITSGSAQDVSSNLADYYILGTNSIVFAFDLSKDDRVVLIDKNSINSDLDIDSYYIDRTLDSDGDGIKDYLEIDVYGTDPYDVDTDGDGIPDGWEIQYGLNPLSASTHIDTDADGASDYVEYVSGTDPTNTDTDGDGIPDGWEMQYGLSPVTASADNDEDGDDATDYQEYVAGTDPTSPDTDDDGLRDGWEIQYGLNPLSASTDNDPDNDGLTNIEEYDIGGAGTNPKDWDTDNDQMPDGWEVDNNLDPLVYNRNVDADGEGLTDYQEYDLGSDPNAIDTDNDGADDYLEYLSGTNLLLTDSDGDGMRDGWELQYGLPAMSYSAGLDSDNDGVTDYTEFLSGTNPILSDSDGDGMPDNWELQYGLRANVPDPWRQSDGDGLSNLEEYVSGTNPIKSDTDGDGMPDNWELQYPEALDPNDPTDANVDYDGDNWTNLQEYQQESDPTISDSDLDGMPDDFEITYGLNPAVDDANLDPDGDTLTNLQEYVSGTNPASADTDGDGTPDNWELQYSLNAISASSHLDPDGDTLTNLQEYVSGTNPTLEDTDGDGINDNIEPQTYGTDPTLFDTDEDGLSDYEEVFNKPTDPLVADADNDGLLDGAEYSVGANPLVADTDGDGLLDGIDNIVASAISTDADGDGLSDAYEWNFSLDPWAYWKFDYGMYSDSEGSTLASEPGDQILLWKDITGRDRDLVQTLDEAGNPTANVLFSEDGIVGRGLQVDSLPSTNGKVTFAINVKTYSSSADYYVFALSPAPYDTFGNYPYFAVRLENGVHLQVYNRSGLTTLKQNIATAGDYVSVIIEFDVDNSTINAYINDASTPVYTNTSYNLSSLLKTSEGIISINSFAEDWFYNSAIRIKDFLIFDRAVTSEERSEIMSYLLDPSFISDPKLADTDADGLSDGYEINTSLTNPNREDSDSDGLLDGVEILSGTNPSDSDTDNDGLLDGIEISYGTNPLSADEDSDGLTDKYEIILGTNPSLADSDSDNLLDAVEVNADELPPMPWSWYQLDEELYADNPPTTEVAADGLVMVWKDKTLSGRDLIAAISPATYYLTTGLQSANVNVAMSADADSLVSNNRVTIGSNYYSYSSSSRAYLYTLKTTIPAGSEMDLLRVYIIGSTLRVYYLENTLGTTYTSVSGIPTSTVNNIITEADFENGTIKVYLGDSTAPVLDVSGLSMYQPAGNSLSSRVVLGGYSLYFGRVQTTMIYDNVLTSDEKLNLISYLQNEGFNFSSNPTAADSDNDGLLDGYEVNTSLTDPLSADSDDDGLIDGIEILSGTNPNNPDTDGDGISDETELSFGLNPLLTDTNANGISDFDELYGSIWGWWKLGDEMYQNNPPTTLVTGEVQYVRYWQDKSNNSRHLTSTSPPKYYSTGLFGYPGDRYLEINEDPLTVTDYMVMGTNLYGRSNGASQPIMRVRSTIGGVEYDLVKFFINSSTLTISYLDSNLSIVSTSFTDVLPLDSGYHTFVAEIDRVAGTLKVYVDDHLSATVDASALDIYTGSQDSSKLLITGQSTGSGILGTVAIYDSPLSDTQRSGLVNYLNNEDTLSLI